jgi:phenylacetate-CoA ligase
VRLLPLALTTVIEEGAQVTQFQLLCTASDRLELRFEAEVAEPRATFRRAQAALSAYLRAQGLPHVAVDYGSAPPLRHARSGKLERVRYGASRRGRLS